MRKIKSQTTKLRDSDPREKSGPREDFAGVHKARDLRNMLIESRLAQLRTGTANLAERTEAAEEALRTFSHWLKDLQHEYRMTRDLPEQTMIQRIIDRIGTV